VNGDLEKNITKFVWTTFESILRFGSFAFAVANCEKATATDRRQSEVKKEIGKERKNFCSCSRFRFPCSPLHIQIPGNCSPARPQAGRLPQNDTCQAHCGESLVPNPYSLFRSAEKGKIPSFKATHFNTQKPTHRHTHFSPTEFLRHAFSVLCLFSAPTNWISHFNAFAWRLPHLNC